MRFCSSDISKNRWVKIRLCVLVLIALIAVIGFTILAASKPMARAAGPGVAATATKRSASFALQNASASEHLESELVTIRPEGFDPAAITRPKGRFFLFVDNRSGLDAVTLRLDRVAGNRLHDVRVPREKLDWTEMVDLTPGEYLLTEADHLNWVCKITITAQ